MSFTEILMIFFSGVLAHAAGIRIFNTWSKSLLYKMTFINCLVILRMCQGISKDVLKAANVEEEKSIEIIFKHWQKMSLYSIKNVIPESVWREISVTEWEQAMKILSNIEKNTEEKNEV